MDERPMTRVCETTPLTEDEISQYHENGFLMIYDAIDPCALENLINDFDKWLLESSNHSKSFGKQMDGRPRFSLEAGHSKEKPALRRVASPVELSESYLEIMRNGKAVDAVCQLIGLNIKFNNSKINSKQPGTNTKVKFHQDFMFEPHSNDDLITVLFFLTEVTLENGPLVVVPGSHLGPLYSHWHNGVFTGAVSEDVALNAQRQAVTCHGPAGSACLMSTRLLHGSEVNFTRSARTLYIVEYCAEDAYPLQDNHIPSIYTGEVVRGESTNRVRCTNYEMEIPEYPKNASFFEQQKREIK